MNLVVFQTYWLGTPYASLWYPAPGVDTKRIERVFAAKHVLGQPRAMGRG